MNEKRTEQIANMIDEQNALQDKEGKCWLDGYSVKECNVELEKALLILHQLEDQTNYDIKGLGKAITLLMELDFNKEFKVFNNE